MAPQDPRIAGPSIVGHWRLVSTRAWTADGTEVPETYGPVSLGIVTLTAEGRMLAVLCDGRPELPAGQTRAYRSYMGAYSFDGTTLHTVVDGADTPDWLGTNQIRAARFENGRMFLRPPARVIDGREIHRELAWERLVPETP